MDLKAQLIDELKQLAGFSAASPKQVRMTDPQGLALTLDVLAADSLSCSLRSLSLYVPKLAGCDPSVVRDWAVRLSKKVTYLLEQVGPIETDATNGTVLIRSTPPDRDPASTRYYEILLSAQSDGTFRLNRYRSERGQSGREAVDLLLTHEVLKKLVGDLIETLP